MLSVSPCRTLSTLRPALQLLVVVATTSQTRDPCSTRHSSLQVRRYCYCCCYYVVVYAVARLVQEVSDAAPGANGHFFAEYFTNKYLSSNTSLVFENVLFGLACCLSTLYGGHGDDCFAHIAAVLHLAYKRQYKPIITTFL